MVDRPAFRIVCVIDVGGVLLGLLPVADLVFAAFVHVVPEVSLKPANDPEQSHLNLVIVRVAAKTWHEWLTSGCATDCASL